MQFHTQTELNPGNCWQTAIACLLDVDPSTLPPQAEIQGWRWDGGSRASYWNVVQRYLRTHHGLIYAETHAWEFGCFRPRAKEWIQTGTTIRSGRYALDPTSRHTLHCVVVYNDGEGIWDVHPSRAGLLTVECVGALGPVQYTTLEHDRRKEEQVARRLDDEADSSFLDHWCLCPAHKLDEARKRVARLQEIHTRKET